jgi:glycosyltransferase involved in cell wall biosynthesis
MTLSNFSADWYLTTNPDVADSDMDPLKHYLNFGQFEGRLPAQNQAFDYESILWHSKLEGLSQLELLINRTDSTAYELGYAYWALVRWHASHNEWQLARGYVDKLMQMPKLEGAPSHLGPLLASFTTLSHCGEFVAAKQLLLRGIVQNSESADIQLAKCNLLQLSDMSFEIEANALDCLNRIFELNSISPVRCKVRHHPLTLDNLITEITRDTVNSEQAVVTVILPVFNAGETLTTALDSLLVQSWRTLEIIVVDDYSEDDTLTIATAFAERDQRVQVLRHHVNQGAYAARNTGLQVAKGDYITTHDADDWSHSQKIEIQVQALIDSAECVASVSHWARCSSELIFGTWRQEASWIHRNVSSLMFRRSVFERLGYWDRVAVNADTEYYYRLLKCFGPQAITEVKAGVPLSFGRSDPNSLTQNLETHLRTQFFGVRKDYMEAAKKWHQSCDNSTRGLYLEFNPKVRPFVAPELIVRPGFYTGSNHLPVIFGDQSVTQSAKTVLLCSHAAGKTLFGAERSLLDLAKAITQLGFNLIVTLPELGQPYYMQALKDYACKIILLPTTWWHHDRPTNVRVVIDFQEIIQTENVDLVHVNTIVLKEPLLAAKKQNIPALVHVRELPELDPAICHALGADAEQIRQNLLKWADAIVVNSQCTNRYIDAPYKTWLLYNTVEQQIFLPQQNAKETRFALISSNIPKKGMLDFVELAKRAESLVPNAKFLLIGPENEHTDALFENRKIPNNLVIAGYAKTPEDALSQADVVLNLSSFQESFGRTVAEAMAAGLPAVGYRWGALPELIDNGRTGYLVHLGDIEGLLRRVQILTNSPDLRTKMGLAGNAKMTRQCGFDVFTQTLGNMYSNLTLTH